MRVTGTEIWEKLNENPQWMKLPEAAHPFVDAMPDVLEDLLDSPATLQNVAIAKTRFYQYCMENHLAWKIYDSLPSRELRGTIVFHATQRLKESMQAEMKMLSRYVSGPVSQSEDKEVMLSNYVGLERSVKELYAAGTLTIGQLLKMQPLIIYNNW